MLAEGRSIPVVWTVTRVQPGDNPEHCVETLKAGTRGPFDTLQQVLLPNVPMRWTIVAGRLHLRTANGETVVFRSQPSPKERRK